MSSAVPRSHAPFALGWGRRKGSLLFFGFVCVAALAIADNAAFSEDFEQGRGEWRPPTLGAIVQNNGHGGTAGVKLTDADPTAYMPALTRTVKVKSNSRYKFSFWYLSADSPYLCVSVLQKAADGTAVQRDGNDLVNWFLPVQRGGTLGKWQQSKNVINTSPKTTHCVLRLSPAEAKPGWTGTVVYDDIELRYVRAAEDSLPLKPLHLLKLDFHSEHAAIVCPDVPPLRTAGEGLADAIEAVTEHRPRVLDDDVAVAALGLGPVVVVGNLMNNALSRRLYLTGYDFTDMAWPGRGGHVVRTVRDPFGTGAHILVVSGSCTLGTAKAAARAATIIETGNGRLATYENSVSLGENADIIKAWTSPVLAEDADWKRQGAWGSWQYLENIGKAGMGYLRTGDEAYLGPFRCELLRFFKQDVFERAQEAPSQIHSCVDLILAPWNLLADHPFFTTEQRRDIDEKFLLLACSHEGPRQLAKAGWGLRGNHGLGRALDGFWLGRYFQRRYGVPEATEWLEYVDRYFEPQLLSNKPTEDGGYHQYQASLLCTLMYAMAAGKQEYLIGTAWREAADRAILEHRVGSGPMAYLSARAVYANDPSYLALVACEGPEAYVKRCAAMKHASVLSESLRSFCGFRTPEARPPLLGARVAPLSPMWHKLMDQQNPRREFRVSTEPEESYDKLVIRDAFEPGSFYLRIDGLGGGGHSFQDANCITEYRDHGLSWLRQQYGYKGPTCSTLRQQNGVFVALDGQGPPGVHACARLLYVRKLGDGLDALGGTLEGIGDVAWERHVLRKRDAWTLVVDRAKALKAGELLVERHWHVTADRSPSSPKENDGVSVYSHAKYSLHLQSVGMLSDDDSGGSSRTEIARFAAAAGESADLASLLFVDAQPQSERFSLEAIPSGWQISDTEGGSTLGVVLTAEGLALAASTVAVPTASALRRLARVPAVPEVDLEWQCIEVGNEVTALAVAEDRLAVGTKAGTVSVFGRDGNQIFRSEVDAEVLSLHAVKTDLLVGTDKGTLFCLEETGSCSWQVTIPYERIGWPHWSDRRSRIREITTADVDGDGSPEIFVSNGDRRLYAFGEDGKQRWRKGVRWGVLVALTPAVCDGAFALLGGVTGPTLGGTVKIHDAHGNIVDRLGVDRMLSQQIRDLRLHDLDGDGTTEIIVARDSASNQLVVCNEDRSLRWKADVGGSPDALAVRDWKGTPQILCASRAGYLHAFDGDSGRQQWFCYFGDDPRMVCSRTDGTVLVLCPSGRIFVVSPTGTLTSRCQLPAPITALLRPGEHRVRPSCIPIGLKNGSVHVLW